MRMDILHGKTPEMVRKEIWAHLLAYNLIRKIMAEAARKNYKNPQNSGTEPRVVKRRPEAFPRMKMARYLYKEHGRKPSRSFSPLGILFMPKKPARLSMQSAKSKAQPTVVAGN